MANDHLLRLEIGPRRCGGHHRGLGRVHAAARANDGTSLTNRTTFPTSPSGQQRTSIRTRCPATIPPLAVALHLDRFRAIFETDPTGTEILWLPAGDAWASIASGQVRQADARNLWDEAVMAYQWWNTHGRPDREQFHLTVSTDRQWVWPDDPANVVTVLT